MAFLERVSQLPCTEAGRLLVGPGGRSVGRERGRPPVKAAARWFLQTPSSECFVS